MINNRNKYVVEAEYNCNLVKGSKWPRMNKYKRNYIFARGLADMLTAQFNREGYMRKYFNYIIKG